MSGHLSIGSHSEQNANANTLISFQLKGGKWWLQVHAMTLSPENFDIKSTRILFIKNMYIKICTTTLDMWNYTERLLGMYKVSTYMSSLRG